MPQPGLIAIGGADAIGVHVLHARRLA
jgi:hypothetical protein